MRCRRLKGMTPLGPMPEALAALRPYDEHPSVAPYWRIRLLRAYGHVYAAQGAEQESLAKFREALHMEAKR